MNMVEIAIQPAVLTDMPTFIVGLPHTTTSHEFVIDPWSESEKEAARYAAEATGIIYDQRIRTKGDREQEVFTLHPTQDQKMPDYFMLFSSRLNEAEPVSKRLHGTPNS